MVNNAQSFTPAYVGIDIETVPAARLVDLPAPIQDWVGRKLEAAGKAGRPMNYEQLAALTPALGKIACVSTGWVRPVKDTDGREVAQIRLLSFSGDEKQLLERFLKRFDGFRALWVHYNGLGFDIPFLLFRMQVHRLCCTIPEFDNLRRFQFRPHYDLLEKVSCWDRFKSMPLEVLSLVHGLPSPKTDLCGADVAAAYERGEYDRICRYCEWDVATTLNLFRIIGLRKDPVGMDRAVRKAPGSSVITPLESLPLSKERLRQLRRALEERGLLPPSDPARPIPPPAGEGRDSASSSSADHEAN